MKHIEIAMSKLDLEQEVNQEHVSIVEQILRETRNPKIAAVLALDLMLVGVDTVSCRSRFFMTVYPSLRLKIALIRKKCKHRSNNNDIKN
jgi:hypothetical protein